VEYISLGSKFRKYLNFCSIVLLKNLQMHHKHYDKESEVLGMLKIKFLEVKLQNFAKSATKVLPFCGKRLSVATNFDTISSYFRQSTEHPISFLIQHQQQNRHRQLLTKNHKTLFVFLFDIMSRNTKSKLTCTHVLRPPLEQNIGNALHPSWHCAWSNDGQSIATCRGRSVYIWTNHSINNDKTNNNISNDKTNRIGNSINDEWICHELQQVHDRTVRCVEFNPMGTVLASASFDGTVAIYEKKLNGKVEWECTAQLEGHESEVKYVCWSSNGTLLATCGRDKTVWIWECSGGPSLSFSGNIKSHQSMDFECIAVLQGHSGDVKSVYFTPSLDQFGDGEELLLSCSYDNTVRCWAEDAGEWYCAATLDEKCHTSTVWSLSITSGGARILTASDDGCIGIWKCYTAKEARSMSLTREISTDGAWKCVGVLSSAHDGPIYSIDAAPSKSGHCRIASVGADDCLNIYYEVSGRSSDSPLFDLDISAANIHAGDILCVRWNPCCGSVLATVGDDGALRLWSYSINTIS